MELDLHDCQLINLARIIYLTDPNLPRHPLDDVFMKRYPGAVCIAAEAGLPPEDLIEQCMEATVEP